MKTGSRRWFLRNSVWLFGAATVLFGFAGSAAIIPVADLTSALLPSTLDPGWATLIGAAVGLGAIALQTRAGFANLRQSQAAQAGLDRLSREQQAKLDREARLHQADLDRSRDDLAQERERRALAAALNGELLTLHSKFLDSLSIMRVQAAAYAELAKYDNPASRPPFRIAGMETPILDANVSRLGLLPPNLISDVLEVFGKVTWKLDLDAKAADPKMISSLLSAVLDKWKEISDDFLHVQQRLLAIQHGAEDPGPLFLARKKRSESITKGEG